MGAKVVRVDGLNQRISTAVRMLIARDGLTQGELAERAGLDQAVISARLRGVSRWTADDLELLGRAFGVHPGVFFEDPKDFRPTLEAVVTRPPLEPPSTRWYWSTMRAAA
jgi:transcriptional regulator with XRE-family HTH domain